MRMALRVWLMAGLALFASDAATQCNYYQEAVAGQTYYVYSPGYPDNYTGRVNCNWHVIAPSRSRINLECNDFHIAPSNNCKDGKLLVSLTGDASLSDGRIYCGYRAFTLESESNQMTVRFISSHSSEDRFLCTMTVIQQHISGPSNCTCGWKKQPRIVNGNETGMNEYPMMAALVDFKNRDVYCGASIIASRYCLTAAHCVHNRPANTIGVIVGDHNITSGSETNSARLVSVESFQTHPKYNSATQENDIAVIRVQQYITYSYEVGPACLPFRFPNVNVGAVVTLLGWGTTELAGPKSQVLLQAQLDVINLKNCSDTFGSKVSSNQMCTFRKGTDACQGDSGGPVLWSGPNDRLYLLGIISYSKDCAFSSPVLNTRVYPYLEWILGVTQDGHFSVV